MSGYPTIWAYGASIAQSVFNGGQLRSQLEVVEAEQRQALLGYMQTAQRAFGDVSDALIDYRK